MTALSEFLGQLMQDNGIKSVSIQDDNVKETHRSRKRRSRCLRVLYQKTISDCPLDRWAAGSPKPIPNVLSILSPALGVAPLPQMASAKIRNRTVADSMLSLPRRKKSPRRKRSYLDLMNTVSIQESGRNARWGNKAVETKNFPEKLFLDNYF
eukprot:scaffold9523_cov103-Cylindrotheca_fusiformis.AAC.10